MAHHQDALASARIVSALTRRRLTLAIAESLTGGLLTSAIVDTPGASAVLRGGVVAYDTRAKASVLGVDAGLLARGGAVDPEVALEMAQGVRRVFTLEGTPADIGIATTGVAGPDPQDGHPVGTVFVAWSVGDRHEVRRMALTGDRSQIRSAVVSESLRELADIVERLGE